MTVQELINRLKDLPPDAVIGFRNIDNNGAVAITDIVYDKWRKIYIIDQP